MAKCKKCGADISDTEEYCENCKSQLNTAMDSESYLDGLLDSVMTKEPERRETASKKRRAGSPVLMSEKKKGSDAVKKKNSAFSSAEPLADYSIFKKADEDEIDRMLSENLSVDTAAWQPGEQDDWNEPDFEEESDEKETLVDKSEEQEEKIFEDVPETKEEQDNTNEDILENQEESPNESEDEIPDEDTKKMSEQASADTEDIDELLTSVKDEIQPDENQVEKTSVSEAFVNEDKVIMEPVKEVIPEKLPEENPVETKDIAKADVSDFSPEADKDEQELIQDNSVVDQDLIELLSGFDEGEESLFEFGSEEKKDSKTENKPEPEKASSQAAAEDAGKKKKVEGKKEKKKGIFASFFHRLFDNVKLDPKKVKKMPTPEELAEKKKADQEAKAKSKEEKDTLLAEKKEEDKRSKEEKLRKTKEAKEEKKARKLEEAKLLLEEMESTRINRAGASIIFIFFAMIAVVIVVGTSIFSYSLSVKNAEYEFNRDEYTAAYNEIFGLDVKDEDIVLYDRIMTVMYVQKQLNSYFNYYELKQYPQALDSLLKGLLRYEKYIDLAVSLEIEDDMDNVRGSEADQSAGKKSILGEIYATFSLSEQEAMEILQSKNRAEYSRKVYEAAAKRTTASGEKNDSDN